MRPSRSTRFHTRCSSTPGRSTGSTTTRRRATTRPRPSSPGSERSPSSTSTCAERSPPGLRLRAARRLDAAVISEAMRKFVSVLALAVLAGAAACSDSPTAPSSSAPYSQVDLRIGTGAEAVTGTTVSVNYTGWLYDPTKPDGKGLLFDTSIGATPLPVLLGSGQVIQGFDRGVTGMKVGGARRI